MYIKFYFINTYDLYSKIALPWTARDAKSTYQLTKKLDSYDKTGKAIRSVISTRYTGIKWIWIAETVNE